MDTWGRDDPRLDKFLWLANETALLQAMALNAAFDHPLTTNLERNMLISGLTAPIVCGGLLLFSTVPVQHGV